MDAAKYRNGREVKLGDEVVWRSPEGKAWSGTVLNSEPQWNTLGLVPQNVSLVYAKPSECLHVDDAFGPNTSTASERGPGANSGGVAKEPEPAPDQVKPPEAPVKPEPKPGEEGGPAIIAAE